MKREARNRQAVLATTAEPEECAHEAADARQDTTHSRAVDSADDMRKDQELHGLQRHDLALRTELKEAKDQWFALQKQLRLQAVTDKSGHTETLMTVDTWRPRTLDKENLQRAVGVNLTSSWNGTSMVQADAGARVSMIREWLQSGGLTG